MAGLLTDSLPDAFPTLTIDTWSVVKVNTVSYTHLTLPTNREV